jgi:hypothetical protein
MLSFTGGLKVRGAGAGGSAQELQRTGGPGQRATRRGSAPGRVVRLHQPAAHAPEDPVLGWDGAVASDQGGRSALLTSEAFRG